MNTEEARQLLADHLEQYRALPYEELVRRISHVDTAEVIGAAGEQYQLEIQVIWDGPRGEAVRVLGAIDDGGWRAFIPLTADFAMGPDGRFVGE
jgi:hypothetical protein